MGFRSEMPVVSLAFDLMHFAIAFLVLFLVEGVDATACIDDSTFPHHQTLRRKVFSVSGLKILRVSSFFSSKRRNSPESLSPVPFRYGGRYPETTNCLAVIDCVLDALSAKALLGNVHAQHARESDRRASAFNLRIEHFVLMLTELSGPLRSQIQ